MQLNTTINTSYSFNYTLSAKIQNIQKIRIEGSQFNMNLLSLSIVLVFYKWLFRLQHSILNLN
jgi:hypothetical protein